MAPMMIRQMTLINKMSHASPHIRMIGKLFKNSKLPIPNKAYHAFRAVYDYAKQTKVNLVGFYFYNIIQFPVFIIMVLSIRKISFENEDLRGTGCLWFPNLNEADSYMILPLLSTALNYFNLTVSSTASSPLVSQLSLAWHHERERTLVDESV